MAKDLITQLGEYRQRRVSNYTDEHVELLIKVLQDLENQVITNATNLPVIGGKLFNTQLAIAIRPKLKALIENYYLTSVQDVINDYDQVAANVIATYGPLPVNDAFKSITDVDLQVIQQLKQFTYSQFEDLANEFSNELANQVYQSTIAGRSKVDMVKDLKGTINGIYQQSDNAEAEELVDFIANNPSKTEQITEASKKLQNIYGRDRLGNNLRRYTKSLIQDSIMGFDGQFAKFRAGEAGLNEYKYTGTIVRSSRDFCITHVGKVYKEDEIRRIWNSSVWEGKKPGDPFVVRGGYNCRHHWQPVRSEWLDDDGNYKLD